MISGSCVVWVVIISMNRFILAGVAYNMLAIGVYELLLKMGVSASLSGVLSYIVALGFSFYANKIYVFGVSRSSSAQYLLFSIHSCIVLVLYGTLLAQLEQFFSDLMWLLGPCVSVLIAFFNYMIFKRFVFKK